MISESQTVDYRVRVRHEGPAGFWAEVVELPGCFASGFTTEELDESLREAIELYLSTPRSRVKVTLVLPAIEIDRQKSTGRHARPDEHVEFRSVELTLC
jgi:predicted RNase H-like HicB family nuclease